MLLTRTPVRVSFCGGGTDLPSFYSNNLGGGAVTSISIEKYIYVLMNHRFESDVRVSYSETEIVSDINDLKHELVREVLLEEGLTKNIEVVTVADIPSRGTGLGSSSALTVGLLHAAKEMKKSSINHLHLAKQACEIEIDHLQQPIGKQDQYSTAIGGLKHILFAQDGSVEVENLPMDNFLRKQISKEFSLVWTGQHRNAAEILKEQDSKISSQNSQDRLLRMREQAIEVRDAFISHDLARVGELLDEGWQLKKGLSSSISNPAIDELYDVIMSCGATGCKLLGAGGGGFILFHGSENVRKTLLKQNPELKIIPLIPDISGTTLLAGEIND